MYDQKFSGWDYILGKNGFRCQAKWAARPPSLFNRLMNLL